MRRRTSGLGITGWLVAAVACAVFVVGCEDRDPIFHADAQPKVDTTEQDIKAELAQLARGKDVKDIEGSALYDEAVGKLTRRGSAIETKVIDAMRTDTDWGVRMGCVEVLQSIGTKTCVEHLIAALVDDQPLVAFHADKTLQELTKHREIPAAAQPAGANGLTPVPVRDKHDLPLDAEARIWAQWHQENKKVLHDAWEAWWKDNKTKTRVE